MKVHVDHDFMTQLKLNYCYGFKLQISELKHTMIEINIVFFCRETPGVSLRGKVFNL